MCARCMRLRRGWSSERARAGPSFLVCNTYRYTGHHVGDINREYYRSKQEEQHWKTERDPIKLLADWLMEQGLAEAAQIDGIQSEVEAEIERRSSSRWPRLIPASRKWSRTFMPETAHARN